jgi:cation:H+ antiporter
VGFVLVAFCSSLPALSVSILAALTENVDVAVGNALGSNLVNVCLILGICLVLAAARKSEKTRLLTFMSREEIGSLYFGLFIGSVIPLALIYLGYASRLVGVLLLVIFGIYTYRLLKPKNIQERLFLDSEPKPSLRKYAALTIVSAIVIIVASYFIVDSASLIALSLHVAPAVIGGTVVAFGTSVSVLLASTRAIRRGHADISLGNIVGTCFVDTTLILGATLTIWTFRVDMTVFSSLVMFSVLANLFLWYFLSSEKIGWREGVVLLFMYFLFLVISFGGLKP